MRLVLSSPTKAPAPSVDTSTLSFGPKATEGADGGAGLVTVYVPDLRQMPNVLAIPARGLVLGREPPPGGVRLPFGSVSRTHTRIGRERGELVVEDLGSRNGTLLNRQRVARSTSLAAGDLLRIGEVLFKVVTSGLDGYARFPVEGIVPAGPTERLRGGYLMSLVRAEIARAAPGELPVLVTGETGTGKELVARALHDASGRRGSLAAVNCAAIPATLLESELFGYRRGAFTGADRDRIGLVKSAEGGTLFLDEIGDMPLEAQAKLLRLLESKEVMPLGSHRAEPVDVRIVCATHRHLRRMVKEERFRADLYARISGHTITLPPLRERPEDVYQLVRHTLERAGASALEARSAYMLGLASYDWPFNVRELASTVQRSVSLSDGILDGRHLPPDVAAALEERSEERREERERPSSSKTEAAPAGAAGAPTEAALRALLLEHEGNVSAVARALGKDRTQVHRWLKRYGISLDEVRGGS